MRVTAFGLAAALSCAAALASPPYANELMLPAGGAGAKSVDASMPHIARGQFIGVPCSNVEHAAADAVRVVIMLAEGEVAEGINGVLATDQTITAGRVHVRMPNFSELAQHTVRVKVFVAGRHGIRTCDAGKVRIV
jgi:hypothetical protein